MIKTLLPFLSLLLLSSCFYSKAKFKNHRIPPPIDVDVASLVFIQVPTSVTQGDLFPIEVKISLRDGSGRNFPYFSPVTLSAHTESSCSDVSKVPLAGLIHKPSYQGTVSFSELLVSVNESIYLKATALSSKGLVQSCSMKIDVVPATIIIPPIEGATFIFNLLGQIDESFGDQGRATPTTNYGDDRIFSVALLPSGKIYTAINSRMQISRLNSDGTVDNSFGVNGAIDYGGGFRPTRRIIVQPDESIVFSSGRHLYKIDQQGEPIAGFGSYLGGSEPIQNGAECGTQGSIEWFDQKKDGGFYAVNGNGNYQLLCSFTANGQQEVGFGNSGILDISQYIGYVYGVTVQGNKILVFGAELNWVNGIILRLNLDGSLDETFGDGGVFMSSSLRFGYTEFIKVKVLPDSIFVLGSGADFDLRSNHTLIYKLTKDGQLDSSFRDSGLVVLNPHTEHHLIEVDKNGSILIAGPENSIGSSSHSSAIRSILPDGQINSSFGSDGVVIAPGTFGIGLAVDPSGASAFFSTNNQIIKIK